MLLSHNKYYFGLSPAAESGRVGSRLATTRKKATFTTGLWPGTADETLVINMASSSVPDKPCTYGN